MKKLEILVENEKDMLYYTERAESIIRKQKLDYLATNTRLHSIHAFVQQHRSKQIDLTLKFVEMKIVLSVVENEN